MAKLLVTGADSIIGSNTAISLCDELDVVAITFRHALSIEGCHCRHAPHDQPESIAEVIRSQHPQWVLHCGRLATSSWDVRDADLDIDHEAELVKSIAAAAADVDARLTVVSSDAVFAGPRLFHDEASPATANRPLSAATSRVERVVDASQALIVRTNAYGWSPVPSEAGFAERMWKCRIDDLPIEADGERHATPILASDLAVLLYKAWRHHLCGILHLTGAERTSPARFASELCAAAGLPQPTLRPIQGSASGSRPAPETSLNTRRARSELKTSMPLLTEGLNRFVEQIDNGFRRRLEAAGIEGLVAHQAA